MKAPVEAAERDRARRPGRVVDRSRGGRDVWAFEVRHGKPEREPFGRCAHLVDLFYVFDRQELDACAAMRMIGDDAVGLELTQRLADGNAARSERASEVVLHELLTGDYRAVEDAATDGIGDESRRAALGFETHACEGFVSLHAVIVYAPPPPRQGALDTHWQIVYNPGTVEDGRLGASGLTMTWRSR